VTSTTLPGNNLLMARDWLWVIDVRPKHALTPGQREEHRPLAAPAG
jgi:hypothetical protein